MNDPNGLHKDGNGTWHLYYQCMSLLLSTESTANDYLR